jgi:2-keto-3-deoxy-L-rhamnonate aldolase RhmA
MKMPDPFDRSFRDRVLARETLFGLFLDLGSSASAELCGTLGYDWLLVDLEHGSGAEAELADQFRAIAAAGGSARSFGRNLVSGSGSDGRSISAPAA